VRDWPRDFILAWRRLRGAPVFALFSILTLALAIGSTTAIYSVVYAVVLRPPDIRGIDRVANLYHMDPRHGGSGSMVWLSRPDFEDYRAAQTSFEFLAAWQRFRAPFAANGSADMLMGEAVGGDYFSVVGVQAALGRTIQPADDHEGAPRVIVLSDGLWRQRFAADPAVVGRTAKLAGEIFEIIGIAPAGFRGVDMPNVLPTSAWIPLSASPLTDAGERLNRERHTIAVKGRLKPGKSIDEAQAEVSAIAKRLDIAYPIGRGEDPRFRRPYTTSRPWFVMKAADVKMHESVDALARPLVATIMIAVALVLLVACTNVANLALARGTARRHETAVRLALGASRARLMREQLVEAGLVACAGAAAAFVVARLVTARLLSGDLHIVPGVSVRLSPEINGSVAAVGLASTALALVVFGLIPAIHGSRGDVRASIASDGQHSPVPRWRSRRGLIACQVAVSAGLVSVAVLCAQQLIALERHDTGMDIDRLAIVQVSGGMIHDEAERRQIFERLLDAARRLPGVQSAALSSGFPIDIGSYGGAIARTPEELTPGRYNFMASSNAVFATWGVRIVQGRGFDDRDSASAEPVVVLTERLAQRLFPTGAAVGHQIVLRRSRLAPEAEQPVRTVTVVGIASETDSGDVGNRGGGYLYLPWTQNDSPVMVLTVRTATNPAALVDPLKRLVNQVDPEMPVMDAEPAARLGGARTIVLQAGAGAAGLLGWLALALAMTGLYGVLSEVVLRRTRELGIRMALGADSGRLLRTVLLDGLRPVLLGLGIGVAAGALVRLSFRPLFIRILPAFDPMVIALVPLAFLAAALLASYVPARRASRVDPNVALRHL
jgi:putative ABC transport system permease protein